MSDQGDAPEAAPDTSQSGDQTSAYLFFPWLSLREPVETPAFSLLPYRRGQAPAKRGSKTQEALDRVTNAYYETPTSPIRRAVVMQVAGHPSGSALSDEQIATALLWGQLVAFSGLATRRFYSHLQYTNRDCFQLVAQRVSDPTSGTTILTRRRDGGQWNHVAAGALRVTKPMHVNVFSPVAVDQALLLALLRRSEDDGWGEIEEGILGYNAANTDSPDVPEEFEAVALVGALERTLGLAGGDDNQLAMAVEARVIPRTSLTPVDCRRIRESALRTRFEKLPSVRNAWVRDFFRLRGDHAHGKRKARYPSVWQLREHLLLAAFFFPLVLKSRLAREGHYRLTATDRASINAFEALACEDHFLEREPVESKHPWNAIIDGELYAELAEQVLDTLVDPSAVEATDLSESEPL